MSRGGGCLSPKLTWRSPGFGHLLSKSPQDSDIKKYCPVMSGLLQETGSELMKEEVPPTYVVEIAKSGRAECKKCDCKIENKNIRVGVIVDGEWGLHTRWQHLDCTVFHKGILSVEELDGFGELDAKSKTAIQERFAESAGEVDEDALPLDPDELVRKAWEQPLEPSTNLLMPLLPYQKEGLGWMTHQEQNDTHGGILADEMGMGKTIQAISLMLQNRPDMSDFAQLREWAASDARHVTAPPVASSTSSASSSAPPAEMVRCGTLIVLPTVAIRQWQTEIARFTKEGSLTVKVYHGSDRNTTALDLTKTDVVLTSYKILEIEYRKATAGTKVTCRLCSKKFYPDKLRIHRKYFCGESAQRTEAQALTQKKKARTSSQNTNTETKAKGRPSGSGTAFKRPAPTATKGRRRPSLSIAEIENRDDESDGEEGEVLTKPAAAAKGRARGRARSPAAAKGKATGNSKGATTAAKKGGRKGSAVVESDSSPHSSENEVEEEAEDEDEGDMPPVKRGRVAAGSASAASASKSSGSKKAAATVKKEIKKKIKKEAEVKIEIKEEPLYFDEVAYQEPVSVSAKRPKKPTPLAPTSRSRKAVSPGVALKRSGDSSAAEINDDTSNSEGDGASAKGGMDVEGESSGSDIDAPPVTRRGTSIAGSATKKGRFSAAASPASGVKGAAKERSATPHTPSAAASANAVPTPVRSSTRAAAQGKKKYADNSDEADSANEYGDLDSEFEQEDAADGEEGREDSGDSDSGSDLVDTELEDEEEGGGGARGRSAGRGERAVGNKKLSAAATAKGRTPSKVPAKRASSVSPRSTKKASPSKASRGSATARATAKGTAKGKGGVGGGRGRAAAAVEEGEDDDDDVAWESGSESSSSDDDDSDDSDVSGEGGEEEDEDEEDGMKNKRKRGSAGKSKAAKGGGSGGGSDSEVERDIQEALLEAANAQRRSKTAAAVSVLHTVSWFRIILDEAHLIKDRSTSTAKSVFNLTSLNKWCLTGTPLQNRVGELYSLIRFLRIDPHAFYYCRSKGCCCKSLHYRFTKSYCDECNHSVIQHYCHFNKHILNPIKRSGYVADGRRAMLKLKQQVLDEILLRRTKTTRFEDIQLPPRIVTVRSERLDVKEEDFYSALYTQSQAQFNTYLQSGTVLNNYAHIFDILIRLRQAVDHPYLVIYSDAQTAKRDDSDNYLNLNNGDDDLVKIKAEPGTANSCCDLCHEPAEDPVCSASCDHSFCRSCITDYIASVSAGTGTGGGSSGLRCPDCDQALTIQLAPVLSPHSNGNGNGKSTGRRSGAGRASANGSAQDLQQTQDSASVWDATKGLSRKSILDKVDLNLFQSSTKIEALMEELYKMQSQDLGAKAIVFSQFVNMLDIISYRLQRGGLQCVKLSGSMGLEQRDKCITAFKTDPNIKVMLISLKAGGVALNLTVASRIFLMDPWWNPAAEMQAIDRTHRIGQHRPIYATRFIIENTIEERILRLQEKKKLVFDGTVGGDSGSMSKLTVDDMRFLFN